MDYVSFRFDVDPPQPGSDILIAYLGDMGFESFEQDDHGFNAYIQAALIDNLALDELQFPGFAFQWSATRVPTVNWNQEWEKNFEPVIVDDLLCIKAPFHQLKHTCSHEITITPKMSFGTGHHQTTRLVCRAMFNLSVAGKNVLDMGCGTGVLAILAALLKAKAVIGIDIDGWSVENARENCAVNGCVEVEIREGDVTAIKRDEMFDLVLANINRNILRRQLPHYARHTVRGGHLVMSGFFTSDCDQLEKTAEEVGFKRMETFAEDEWSAMVFVRQ